MIVLRGLTCQRGTFTLGPIDLKVPADAYLVLVGASGHGKTTLLSALAGIVPSSGSVQADDASLDALAPHRRRVGLVPQGGLLFPHLDVAGNIAYGGTAGATAVRDLADRWGCAHLLRRGVGDLSGGERMRVALARAMAVEPRLLLLDEPLASLDAAGRAALRAELKALRGQRAVVHVTHDLDEAAELSTHLGVLHHGRLVALGLTADMLTRPPSPEAAAILSAAPVRVVR